MEKKFEVVKEWLRKTKEAVLRENREVELVYAFRKEFGFAPDIIQWDEDSPFALSSFVVDEEIEEKKINLITFAATEIYGGQVSSDWSFKKFENFYYWEKKNGKYLLSITLKFDTDKVEIFD
jgi:hypothetical protein